MSSIPYIVGYASQTDDLIFNGTVYNRFDYSGYMASMERGAQGEWAYKLPYTTEPQQGVYVRMPYIFLGHISAWIGLSNIQTFHLARILSGLLLCIGVYMLAARLFNNVEARWFVFFLALLGSGLGWLQWLFGWVPNQDISPIDFWLVDGYPFFILITFPHMIAIAAFLTWQVVCWYAFLAAPSWKRLAWVVLFGVLIQPINPYLPVLGDLALGGAALGVWFERRRAAGGGALAFNAGLPSPLLGLGIVGVSQLPLLVYSIYLFQTDPVWAGFSGQADTLSPPLVYFLWGFGLLWLFALPALWRVIRGQVDTATGMAAAWSIGGLTLSFLPFVFQRRMIYALPIPLGVLGAYAIYHQVFPWISLRGKPYLSRMVWTITWFFAALAGMSSIYLAIGGGLYASLRPPDLFDSKQIVEAAQWLKTHADADHAVLSTAWSGRLVALRTGLTVFIGHDIETLDFNRKQVEVSQFFSGEMAEEETQDWLSGTGTTWVWYGPEEAKLGPPLDPLGMELFFENDQVQIYRIVQ